jgi:hypothetical protein
MSTSRGVPSMLSALVLLAFIGCTRDLGRLRTMATDAPEAGFMVLERGVEGRSCATEMLFGLLPVGGRASLAAAVEDAVGRVRDSQLLADVHVEVRTWEGLLVRRQCVRVVGTAGRRVRVVSIP